MNALKNCILAIDTLNIMYYGDPNTKLFPRQFLLYLGQYSRCSCNSVTRLQSVHEVCLVLKRYQSAELLGEFPVFCGIHNASESIDSRFMAPTVSCAKIKHC